MPIVTTLHTILDSPSPDQRLVLEEVAALSDRLVVMMNAALNITKNLSCIAGKD